MPFVTLKRKRAFLGIFVPEWLVIALVPGPFGISDYSNEPLRKPIALYLQRLSSGVGLYLVALLVSLLIVRLVHLRIGRKHKRFIPHQTSFEEFRKIFLTKHGLILDLRLLQLTCLFFVLFINLKHFVPSVNPYLADRFLIRFDESLMHGRTAGEALIALLGTSVADLLSSGYFLFYPYVAILVYTFLLHRHEDLKLEFFTGFFTVWTLGVFLVYLVPSLGPCFYEPNSVSSLPHTGVTDMQERLWLHKKMLERNPLDSRAMFLISGFPSLHLAVPVYGSLMLHRFRHWMAVCSWIFCALTAVTTLYFGWHYLLDDIAAAMLSVFVYRQTRRYFQNVYVYTPEQPPRIQPGM